jgi:hypothetical protein
MRKMQPAIRVFIAAVTAATFSLPLVSIAQAQQSAAYRAAQCRVVGAISHRCYTFHSDATWREGLSDYHGSNGG